MTAYELAQHLNTDYHVVEQRDWGADRAHWPPILFQYESTKPAPRIPKANHWKTSNGEFILDIVNDPLLDYTELPHTISSCEEPAFLEAWFRSNSRIVMKDIRGRMLQDPTGGWDGGVDPIRSGTLGMRMTRLRETHGMISWRKKKGSEQIKAYLDSILPQACKDANSIKDFRDLHPHERFAMHLGNAGQMPERSHASDKDLSEEKKAAVNQKARDRYDYLEAKFESKKAASTAATKQNGSSSNESDSEELLEQEEEEESDPEDALQKLDLDAEYDSEDWLDSLISTNQTTTNAEVGTSKLGTTDTGDDEGLQAGTAADVSDTEAEDDFLALEAEHQVHQNLLFQLLAPTRAQFTALTGRQPTASTTTTSYYAQWDEIQTEFDSNWDNAGRQGQVPDLIGLVRLTRSEIRWNSSTETRSFPRDTMILIAQLLVDFD